MQTKERMRAAARSCWQRDRRLYWALAALGLVQLALRGVMRFAPAARFAVRYIVRPYHRAMGWLCSFLPFSAAELCWAALIVFCLWYVARTVFLLCAPPWEAPAAKKEGTAPPKTPERETEGTQPRDGARRRTRAAVLWRRVLGGLLTALAVYNGYTLL